MRKAGRHPNFYSNFQPRVIAFNKGLAEMDSGPYVFFTQIGNMLLRQPKKASLGFLKKIPSILQGSNGGVVAFKSR